MQYNESQYNEHQYNADTNDVLNVLVESMTITDDTIVKSIGAIRVESLSSSDLRLHDIEIPLLEGIFPDDVLTKSITNKGLSDTIRMAIWFKIERVPTVNNPWGN